VFLLLRQVGVEGKGEQWRWNEVRQRGRRLTADNSLGKCRLGALIRAACTELRGPEENQSCGLISSK
jgi:hypothetical protein